jgi:hypothetical protein
MFIHMGCAWVVDECNPENIKFRVQLGAFGR